MNYNRIRSAYGRESMEAYSTPLDKLPKKKNLDKFRGCLIGGAAGDALGFPVEFQKENRIFDQFGEEGIREYQLGQGLARISDDTQMTMFTANGLLFGTTRGCTRGIMGSYPSYITGAYQDWYKTQMKTYEQCSREGSTSWLLNVPDMFAERAPGNTCLSAIYAGCAGTIERPLNNSKGCGGVMRVAPIGLYFGTSGMAPLAIDLMGADVAALTHGHEMGYIPAATLVHIVRLAAFCDGLTLKEIVMDSKIAMEALFPESKELPGFLKLIDKAIELSESGADDLSAIHALGPGWCGDEAVAVSIYCALKYSNDFDKGIRAAVNHGGDSDSTGAITGNILGAYLGQSKIPEKYVEKLELVDVLTELADDLFYDCQLDEYKQVTDPRDLAWERKYVYIDYPNNGIE